MDESSTDAARIWADLDEPWQEAFWQAWQALRAGNIAVGACASTPDGEIICAARNRVCDSSGPVGEVFGSALAHAEINVLAQLPFRGHGQVVLTTTLQPCLQCAAAIQFARINTIRFAGADRLWDGYHEFSKLSTIEAWRSQPLRLGPRADELGTFATVISRFGPTLTPDYEQALRALGEGQMVDLVREMERDGEVALLAGMEVEDAFGYMWPRLRELPAAPAAAGAAGAAARPRNVRPPA